MHSVVWASIVASVLVATVVTLIIEYLAKPHLEARKERILEKGRQRRSAHTNFRRSINMASRLVSFKDQPPQIMSLMDDHLKCNVKDLQEYMFAAGEFIEPPESVKREWEYTVSSMYAYVTVLLAVSLALPDNYWENFQNTLSQMKNFRRLFTTSRRHTLRRRKLIKKIKSSPAPDTFILAREQESLTGNH